MSSSLVPSQAREARRAILVLGMHRSGTSAVTRCLNLLGIDLGSDLLPAAADNAKGFWEQSGVVQIHEQLLGELGRTWSDARVLPKGWMKSDAASRARVALRALVRRNFAGKVLWAVKDPRLCRFVPLWLDVLKDDGITVSALLVVRHPFEVAESLRVREGTDHDTAYAAWLQYFCDAEIETRDLRRGLVTYDALLADWRAALSKVARELNVEWPRAFGAAAAEMDAYLDRRERHHVASAYNDAVPELALRLYKACVAGKETATPWRGISCLVDNYRLVAPALWGQSEQLITAVQDARTQMRDIAGVLESTRGNVAVLSAAIDQAGSSLRLEPDHAKLYFKTIGEGFNERHSQHVACAWGTNSAVTLRFAFDPAEPVVGLRFDPSTRPGAFRINGLRINGDAIAELSTCVRAINQISLGRHAADGIWVIAFDDDPYVELALPEAAGSVGQPLIVEMDCRRVDLASAFPSLVTTLLEGVADGVAAHTASLSDLRQRDQQRVAVLAGIQDQLAEALVAAQRKLAEGEAEAVRLQAALRDAETRNGAAQADLKAVQAAAGVTHNKLEAMRTLNADLAACNELQRVDLARLGASVESARSELAAVKQSTAWQVFCRLRGLLLRLPAPLRNALRRGLKAAWWAATPWRMGARLRFLRDRQHQLAVARPSASGQESGAAVLASNALSPQPGYVYASPLMIGGRQGLDGRVRALEVRTMFSIVVPVYNSDSRYLKRAIASVREQWYGDWELILVDDHSSAPEVQTVLTGLDDARITSIRLEENKGISGATNIGIARARGDFIVFLDHDDELTADCLYELALCIDRDHPDFVYSDEDKVDLKGHFTDPFYKPDWSPDTLMSTMYTCHVSCVRRALVLAVGGLRRAFDGSQDWDLVLRVTERTERVSHIAKVLYHWRTVPQSAASDLRVKPYAIEASKRAREDALARRGLAGELLPVDGFPGYFRVRYGLQGHPKFSIIIPSKNNGTVLKNCIDSLFAKTAYDNFELIVINNGSTDAATLGYLSELKSAEQIVLLDHNVPFNYSEINNFGVAHARGDILVFLNDDTEVISPDWLEYMGGYAQLPHIGAVGAKLLYPGSLTVQHSGVVNLRCGPGHAFVNLPGDAPGYFLRNVLEYDWLAVTGACMMMERSKFEAIGGFDEELAVAYNDVDLCFRLYEKGLFQVVCPGIKLLHYESLTRGNDTRDAKKMARLTVERNALFRKHPELLGRDPFHNPNLDPDDAYFRPRAAAHVFTRFTEYRAPLHLGSGGIHCALDNINDQPPAGHDVLSRDTPATFAGWASDNAGHPAGRFAIVLKNESYSYSAVASTGAPRPDVAKALGSDGLAACGFRCTASLAVVAPGVYDLYALKLAEPAVAVLVTARIIIA